MACFLGVGVALRSHGVSTHTASLEVCGEDSLDIWPSVPELELVSVSGGEAPARLSAPRGGCDR